MLKTTLQLAALTVAVMLFWPLISLVQAASPPAPNPQSGNLGVEGRVSGGPPTQGATIIIPHNSDTFTNSPITVSGTCPTGLLVEIFDNGIFVGSVMCTNGTFSLKISLFNGRNDLIARVFDALNQAGPDSNTVTVFLGSTTVSGQPGAGPTLTTPYAKRGADPHATLTWPIILSGGKGPYAISIDWGDKSLPDLISRSKTGTFNIEHAYDQAGVYDVVIRVTDANGDTAYLQVVAISNGPIQQTIAKSGTTVKTKKAIIWWPLVITLLLGISSFWLGRRHQLQTIRNRLHRGERPI